MITRANSYSGTEEEYFKEFKDTNCNDLIEVEIKVNGHRYTVIGKENINTQKEFYRFQTKVMERVESLRLVAISRFKP